MTRICLILLILNRIVTVFSAIAEGPYIGVDLRDSLDVPKSTLSYIAERVCGDLEVYKTKAGSRWTSQQSCEENFMNVNKVIPISAPSVKVKCQFPESATFSLTPANSSNWRLVVIVPDDSDDEDRVNLLTEIYLMPGTEESGRISMSPENYTFWSASVSSDGTHSPWLRGPQIIPWNYTGDAVAKPYSIDVTLVRDVESHTVRARLAWNSTGDNDVCFDVMSFCKGRFQSSKIWPHQKPIWEVGNLPAGETCKFQISGIYGATRINSTLWDCEEEPSDCIDLAKADNITIEASEGNHGGWNVAVKWNPPQHTPYSYNVTLQAAHVNRTVILPGTSTEVVFEEVQDEGFYTVSVVSIIGNGGIHVGKYAMFPVRSKAKNDRGTIPLGMVVTTSSLVALIVALLLTTALVCWRRLRTIKLKRIYFPDADDKPMKEGAMETIDLESGGTEDRWELRSERLLLHEVIGEGAFGVVRRGTLAPGGKEVAVKMLKEFPTLEEIRSFHAEMELMKSVGSHPHVVSLVGCCSGRRPLIVAEYCGRGDLLTYLRCFWDVMVSKRNAKYYNNNIEGSDYRNDLFKCNFQKEHSKLVVNKLYDLQGICEIELTSRDLLSFCRQIAMGMEFLASNRVVHRDLAARNILVSRDRTLKIADFGLSRDVYEENQYKQKGNGKMPVKWMALESLNRRIYTTQSDVWSFGVVVWEIVTVGGSPYPEVPAARLLRLLRAGYRMPRPTNCSKQLYELMMSCWRAQPRARPTFGELHEQLDALLNSACAQDYLSLELDADDARPPHQTYMDMLKEKLGWSRGENYERPFRAPHYNHYSSPPASIARIQHA